MIDRLRRMLFPSPDPDAERLDRATEVLTRRSATATKRASRVIAQYRAAESVASQRSKRTGQVVEELRVAQDAAVTAQEAARDAGEAVIAEIEKQ